MWIKIELQYDAVINEKVEGIISVRAVSGKYIDDTGSGYGKMLFANKTHLPHSIRSDFSLELLLRIRNFPPGHESHVT